MEHPQVQGEIFAAASRVVRRCRYVCGPIISPSSAVPGYWNTLWRIRPVAMGRGLTAGINSSTSGYEKKKREWIRESCVWSLSERLKIARRSSVFTNRRQNRSRKSAVVRNPSALPREKPPDVQSLHDSCIIWDYIEDYAFPRKVSGTHVAYRLYRRGGINGKLWIQLRDFYKDKRHRYKERKRKESGGPDYYVVSSFKLGSLAPLVKRLTYSKILTTTKAAMLLDVKPPAVHRLFEETADLS